uniref:Tyrosine-protein phosphatase domain-containing protein n=1 Tax=Heterorhabditis bacteriophora TaxID=37862 RepID=A0A1I7XQF8_HETBA
MHPLLFQKRSSDVVVYDCVDSSGHMTRMAITRYENDRDVNYFMWSRYLDIESMMPLTMYVCYMCEQMAQSASIANSTYGRRHPMMQMSMPNSNLLAQQSLPSIVVDDSSARQVGVSWVRAAPRHRCVPFLMSTLCEKMAEISHIIVRYHPKDQQVTAEFLESVKPLLNLN